MKKAFIHILVFLEIVLACMSCRFNFSKGVKRDIKTGLSVSYNGFTINDAFVIDSTGKHLQSNKIPINSSFTILVTGVTNFQLQGGKIYPACELTLTNAVGKVLAHSPDIMSEQVKDGLPPQTNNLTATLKLHAPFIVGQNCHVNARFFDKVNPKNELTADLDVMLQ